MRSLMMVRPGARQFELRERPIPSPGSGEVLIEVHATAICGSEVHLYDGEINLPVDYPKVLGHEYSGVAVALGTGVSSIAEGDRVIAESSAGCEQCPYCRAGLTNLCSMRSGISGSFASHVVVPARYVYRLPDHVSLDRATLSEPLACVINGVCERTMVTAGDVVVVIGPGPIGLLSAIVAEEHGAEVILVGRSTSKKRLSLASEKLGFSHVVNTDEANPKAYVESLAPGGADIVIDCAGGTEAVSLGLDVARKNGAFTEMALFADKITVDFEAILRKEITVTGAISHRPTSWQRLRALYANDRLKKAERIITGRYALSEWQDAFDGMVSRDETKALILPEKEK